MIFIISRPLPVAGAALPAKIRQGGPFIAIPELSMTGDANITNHTIPSRYGMSPSRVNITVERSDTFLPGQKGEMAAGPRSTGISAGPLSLAIPVIAIVTVAAWMWYMMKPKQDEPDEEDG